MTGFVFFIHAILCILLAAIVLIQSGRGGGLTENFAAAESLFGAKTNAFLVKATTVFATLFFVTCLSLAVLSAKKEVSLLSKEGLMPGTASLPVNVVTDTSQKNNVDMGPGAEK